MKSFLQYIKESTKPNENSLGKPIAQTEEALNNFWNWFGDSKVVDKQGRPLVVYHGTTADNFNEFNMKNSEGGTHLGSSHQANAFASSENARLYPLYVNMKNPLRLVDEGGFYPDYTLPQLKKIGIVSFTEMDQLLEMDPSEAFDSIVQHIKTAGYDGIIYLNRREGIKYTDDDDMDYDGSSDSDFIKRFPDANDSYIVFDNLQLKSAIANKGTFSKTSNKINEEKI